MAPQVANWRTSDLCYSDVVEQWTAESPDLNSLTWGELFEYRCRVIDELFEIREGKYRPPFIDNRKAFLEREWRCIDAQNEVLCATEVEA